jgi:hypothetical protein
VNISAYFALLGVMVVLLFGVFLFRGSRRLIKRWAGECAVNLSARFFLNKKDYHLLRNVILPTEDETTQIDHLVVSRFGVFVVEIKNMTGLLSGPHDQDEWTEEAGEYTKIIPNPLQQHFRHAKALEEIFGLKPHTIYPVLVLAGGDGEFRTEMSENVTSPRGYLPYIKSKQEPLYGNFEVEEIIEKIENYRSQTNFESLAGIRNLGPKYPPKIRRKLQRAKPASPIFKYSMIVGVLLVFLVITHEGVEQKHGELGEDDSRIQHPPQETSAAEKELNKVYQVQDSSGRTQYTNMAISPEAKLLEGNVERSEPALAIEISDDKVILPVTIGNRGAEVHTSVVLDRNSEKTILPERIANFVKAEDMGTTEQYQIDGDVMLMETRRVNYFRLGSVIEEDFIILVSAARNQNQRGVLGLDFMAKHPFEIDEQRNLLIWQN